MDGFEEDDVFAAFREQVLLANTDVFEFLHENEWVSLER